MNAVDVGDAHHSGGETVGLSGQVAVKLLVAAVATLLGMWGLWHSPRLRAAMATVPGLLLVLLAATFVATSLVALPETARVSRVASLVFLGYVAFILVALHVLGLPRVVASLLVGLVMFLIGSWLLYLLVPALGAFVEDLGAGNRVTRMGGLGHPNALARAAMLSVLLAIALMRSSRRWRRVLAMVVLLGLVTAAAALSRTAIAAGMVAVGVLLVDLLPTRRAVVGGLAATVLLLAGFIGWQLVHAGEPVASSLLLAATKTGNVEELTSATGRTEIWQAAWQWIGQRPWTGYGLGSAPALLVDHSQHTHNILLHPLLSAGVVAVVLLVMLLLWNCCAAAVSAEPLVRGVVAFVLVSGLFEDTLLDTFPGPPTLLWLVATLYPAMLAWPVAQRLAARPAEPRGDADGLAVEGIETEGYTTVVS